MNKPTSKKSKKTLTKRVPKAPTQSKAMVPYSSGVSQSLASPISAQVQLRTLGVRPILTAVTEQFLAQKLDITDPFVTGNSAQVLSQYETWVVDSLELCYEPTCAASQPGVVALRYDPDPTDNAPTSFQQFISTGYNVYGPQWAPLRLKVPASAVMQMKNYFVDPLAGNPDKTVSRFSIPGQVQAYTSADASVTSIGVLSLKLAVKAKTLSEVKPSAVLTFNDQTPVANGADWMSPACAISVSGQPGVFSKVVSTNAPSSIRHIEAYKPGTYRIEATATGTGLGAASQGAMAGETVTGATFTTSSTVTNAGQTIATIVAIIIADQYLKTQFNGGSYSILDILPMVLSGLATLTSVAGTITWTAT